MVRNAGLREVTTPYAFLTDNDIEFPPGSISALLHAVMADGLILCATPRLLNGRDPRYLYGDGNQLHSRHHAKVFGSTRLEDFIGPGHGLQGYDCAASPYMLEHASPWQVDVEQFRGMPVFPTVALCEGRVHFELDPEIAQRFAARFRDFASGQGLRGDWRHRFARVMQAEVPELVFRRVAEAEAYRRVLDEMAMAREILITRLKSPEAGRAFCIPFSIGSETTLRAARELGLEAMFWGAMEARPLNRAGDDPLLAARIKNDFIARLPGAGRRPLGLIYADKVVRRLRGDTGY